MNPSEFCKEKGRAKNLSEVTAPFTQTDAETITPVLSDTGHAGHMIEANKVRSFSMYEMLEKPLTDFLKEGDGVNALPVFEEEYYPDAAMVDSSLINLIKFISTAFGRSRLPQAFKIVERIHHDNPRKRTFRFRSRHPLFVDGSPRYQNVCLVSGMVYLGIPILPYFDGLHILEEEEDPSMYLALLRSENPDLF